jgi:hypothetical protein
MAAGARQPLRLRRRPKRPLLRPSASRTSKAIGYRTGHFGLAIAAWTATDVRLN